MVLAGRVKRDVSLKNHFSVLVPVLKKGNLRFIQGIQASKLLQNIHFCYPSRGVFKGIVVEIESKNLHYVAKLARNAFDFIVVGLQKIFFNGRCCTLSAVGRACSACYKRSVKGFVRLHGIPQNFEVFRTG